MTETWESKAKQKREAVLALIPKEWRIESPPSIQEQIDVTGDYIHQFLTEKEIEITETTADDIVKKTTTGRWSAVEVTKAFCHRAALAHQLLHCLHEIFFEAAISDAEGLDKYYAQHKRPLGPLHGLPISLKDQFHVRDVDTSMGYVGWIGTFEGKPKTEKHKGFESEMVRELRASGAVLYCKTAVPHTLMCGETVNNIIGFTLNPKNRNLSSGGSSGGEGALIGLRGSPVGFGTDIAGSIRIPAAFNGLYGLRPSTGRLPYEGMANSMDGQNSVLSVVGPLATSVASLRLVTKAVLAQEPWKRDPLVHEIPWRFDQEREILELTGGIGDASKVGRLRFGVLRHDGAVRPTPPVRRAIEEVVSSMEALGHEVVEWNPPPHAALYKAAGVTWGYDGSKDVRAAFALSGEPMKKQVATLFENLTEESTATDIAKHNVELRKLRKEYLDYWVSTAGDSGRPIDAIIAPAAQFPASRPEMFYYYGYTGFVNVLDLTSVIVPVTNADKEIDKKDEPYDFVDNVDKRTYESYDPEIYHGAHVCVQLVGRRLQEEKMLAIAEYVGNAVGKRSV